MKRALQLAAVFPLLGLTACLPAAGIGSALELANTVYGKINANVQQAAVQLHDNCVLLQGGLLIGQGTLQGAGLQRAVRTGEQVLASYCTGAPPTDVPTALKTVARVYQDVITAKAAAANATPALSGAGPAILAK